MYQLCRLEWIMRRIFKKIVGLMVAGALLLGSLSFSVLAEDTESEADVDLCDVEAVIRDGFYGFEDSIDISEYAVLPEALSDLFSYVLKDDPYLFFVDGHMSYSYRSGGEVLCLKPNYLLFGKDVFDAWEKCRDYIKKTASLAMEYESELERALFLHDYICENFYYDESFFCDNIYKMIVGGKGTCQAYTDLYMALLRECGIESHFVASDTVAHIWNYVKIDGEWYHADVTWDDMTDGYRHRHFLLDDSAAEERGHVDWYSPIEVDCLSEKYIEVDFESVLHQKYETGDVDHDGECGIMDVMVFRRATEGSLGTDLCEECADLTADGKIDTSDLALIREKVAMKNFSY